jgi:bacterioferritin-associated ferredoxin
MTPPTIEDMGKAAEEIVWRVMGKGSDKSKYGEWFLVDRPVHDYHIARAIRHLATAMMQLQRSTPCPDGNGETATDHLERAVVRALFVWAQVKKEVPRL